MEIYDRYDLKEEIEKLEKLEKQTFEELKNDPNIPKLLSVYDIRNNIRYKKIMLQILETEDRLDDKIDTQEFKLKIDRSDE